MLATSPIDLERLDPHIRPIVEILASNGVETFESCQGGDGHSFYEPTVRFHGNHAEGFRALAIALQHWLRVCELRRYYSIEDGEPVGPRWEMTFLVEAISLRGSTWRSPDTEASRQSR
jgi:hypothetical protein